MGGKAERDSMNAERKTQARRNNLRNGTGGDAFVTHKRWEVAQAPHGLPFIVPHSDFIVAQTDSVPIPYARETKRSIRSERYDTSATISSPHFLAHLALSP